MHYVYLYVEKNVATDCIKFGMKLSEYADRIIIIDKIEKNGIKAYLSPKDSVYYNNIEYCCLKINIEHDLENVFVCDNLENNNIFSKSNSSNILNYEIGSFENPSCIIATSILPENISLYNKIIDSPLIVEDSQMLFYQKNILNIIDNFDTKNLKTLYYILKSDNFSDNFIDYNSKNKQNKH